MNFININVISINLIPSIMFLFLTFITFFIQAYSTNFKYLFSIFKFFYLIHRLSYLFFVCNRSFRFNVLFFH